MIPVVECIPTAASAIPYNPSTLYEMKIATQIKSSGIAVDCIPTARPLMIVVAAPVSDCSPIFLTGL